jgi:hypothetical protein
MRRQWEPDADTLIDAHTNGDTISHTNGHASTHRYTRPDPYLCARQPGSRRSLRGDP